MPIALGLHSVAEIAMRMNIPISLHSSVRYPIPVYHTRIQAFSRLHLCLLLLLSSSLCDFCRCQSDKDDFEPVAQATKNKATFISLHIAFPVINPNIYRTDTFGNISLCFLVFLALRFSPSCCCHQ